MWPWIILFWWELLPELAIKMFTMNKEIFGYSSPVHYERHFGFPRNYFHAHADFQRWCPQAFCNRDAPQRWLRKELGRILGCLRFWFFYPRPNPETPALCHSATGYNKTNVCREHEPAWFRQAQVQVKIHHSVISVCLDFLLERFLFFVVGVILRGDELQHRLCM